MKEFYSVPEFAAKLGISPDSLRKRIKRGSIQAVKLGKTKQSKIRIPATELDRLKGEVNASEPITEA